MQKLKLLPLLLSLFSFSAIADISQSFLCGDKRFEYKNVTCCTERVSESKCIELVDKYIQDEYINLIKTIYTNANDGMYGYGSIPNCHWNAVSFHNAQTRQRSTPLAPYELADYLDANTQEIPKSQRRFGDIIVFEALLTERVKEYDMNNMMRFVYSDYKAISHSAIYLEENYMFQKESLGNIAFTIDTADSISRNYEKTEESDSRIIKAVMDTKTYRKN